MVICRIEDSPFSYDELMNLIYSSVEERVEQNLIFNVSKMSASDFRNKNKDGIILVAFNNNELIGTSCIHILTDNKGKNFAYHEHVFVNPKSKRSGVASKLMEKHVETAYSNGCLYIISDTAVKAKSSVRWHLKNGFRIIGLYSFKSTNYYSYIFRRQLVDDPKWSNRYCKMKYCLSAMKCRFYYRENGNIRFPKLIGLYHKLRGVN